MSKIKSTLDLVMERTKNLNMTEKDRELLQEKQNSEKARMWVQKYLSRKMDADEIGHELEKQGRSFPGIRLLVYRELVGHLNPAGGNSMVLHALQDVFGTDPQSIRDLMQSFQADLKEQIPKYAAEMISYLNSEGFSGSSLVPNLERNTSWKEYVRHAHQDLRSRISSLTGS